MLYHIPIVLYSLFPLPLANMPHVDINATELWQFPFGMFAGDGLIYEQKIIGIFGFYSLFGYSNALNLKAIPKKP